MLQLCLALKFSHDNNILHRDIKAANVLISAEDDVKLSDFGLAKHLSPSEMIKHFVGTPLYISPEIIKDQPYSFKADVWSLGVIFYELMALEPPFFDTNFEGLSQLILNKEPKPLPEIYSSELREFVMRMLSKDPETRPLLAELFESSLLTALAEENQREMEICSTKEISSSIQMSDVDLKRDFEKLPTYRFSNFSQVNPIHAAKASGKSRFDQVKDQSSNIRDCEESAIIEEDDKEDFSESRIMESSPMVCQVKINNTESTCIAFQLKEPVAVGNSLASSFMNESPNDLLRPSIMPTDIPARPLCNLAGLIVSNVMPLLEEELNSLPIAETYELAVKPESPAHPLQAEQILLEEEEEERPEDKVSSTFLQESVIRQNKKLLIETRNTNIISQFQPAPVIARNVLASSKVVLSKNQKKFVIKNKSSQSIEGKFKISNVVAETVVNHSEVNPSQKFQKPLIRYRRPQALSFNIKKSQPPINEKRGLLVRSPTWGDKCLQDCLVIMPQTNAGPNPPFPTRYSEVQLFDKTKQAVGREGNLDIFSISTPKQTVIKETHRPLGLRDINKIRRRSRIQEVEALKEAFQTKFKNKFNLVYSAIKKFVKFVGLRETETLLEDEKALLKRADAFSNKIVTLTSSPESFLDLVRLNILETKSDVL